jgi:hypothetical protein
MRFSEEADLGVAADQRMHIIIRAEADDRPANPAEAEPWHTY